jgi:hypothetical protein
MNQISLHFSLAEFGFLGVKYILSSNSVRKYAQQCRLSRLLQCLKEGKLGVLYMNGHYSVILKVRSLSSFEFSKKIYIFFYYIYPSFLFLQQEKILLTLETDEGVLNNLPTAIWKRLTVV